MMLVPLFLVPLVITLLWLFSIRPYCIRNRKGYTPGANLGVTFWVDWDQARELAKAEGNRRMLLICRVVLWLQILAVVVLLFGMFRLFAL